MKTEEAKNKFIKRHFNALIATDFIFENSEISQKNMVEFMNCVERGKIYLLKMGYSNIHSLRSIIDVSSWETSVCMSDLPFNDHNLEKTLIMVRAFVIYTFCQRFNMELKVEDGNATAYLADVTISTWTMIDFRMLYLKMLKKESKSWHKKLMLSQDSEVSYDNIKVKANELFRAMKVDGEADLSITLGAIDDFIIASDFSDDNACHFTDVLVLAFGGILVNNEGASWLDTDDGIYIEAVFFDDAVLTRYAIYSQIQNKGSNDLFNTYISRLKFYSEYVINQKISMNEMSLQTTLALKQLGTIKN